MTGFSITLEARNPDRGHYRAYRLEAAPDLFGVWLVEATFGRIGLRWSRKFRQGDKLLLHVRRMRTNGESDTEAVFG